MKLAFFILLAIEVIAFLYFTFRKPNNSDDAQEDAWALIAVFLISVVIDFLYAIVWLIVRHFH